MPPSVSWDGGPSVTARYHCKCCGAVWAEDAWPAALVLGPHWREADPSKALWLGPVMALLAAAMAVAFGSAVLRTARTNTESTGSDAAAGQRAPGAGIADPATRTHHDAAQPHNHNFRGRKRSCYWPAL